MRRVITYNMLYERSDGKPETALVEAKNVTAACKKLLKRVKGVAILEVREVDTRKLRGWRLVHKKVLGRKLKR